MERLTEIKTHVTGFSYTDKKEGIFAQNVFAKLAAYEDTGLTPEQIQAQQQEIERLKHHIDNLIRWNEEHVKARAEKEKIIEAQKHEINKFRTERDMEVSKTNKLYAEIRALTADKDEQTEQMKYLLRRTLPILEVANDQQGLIDAINALLGGKEDEK